MKLGNIDSGCKKECMCVDMYLHVCTHFQGLISYFISINLLCISLKWALPKKNHNTIQNIGAACTSRERVTKRKIRENFQNLGLLSESVKYPWKPTESTDFDLSS